MSYSAKAVANYLLSIAEPSSISPMKMQKLVYYSHGWYLAVAGGIPLIDEQIEAWLYGPVVPSLFRELKIYGNGPIEEPLTAHSAAFEFAEPWENVEDDVPSLDDYGDLEGVKLAKRVIETTWKEYGQYSAIQLSNMTHENDGPWDTVMQEYNYQPPRGTDIPTDIIYKHFKESLDRHLQEVR